jgi:hypothetical protein
MKKKRTPTEDEIESSPYVQARKELVAAGLLKADGAKFENGKWRTVWKLTPLGEAMARKG